MGICRLSLFCETIPEERSAGTPHDTFCGNRRWIISSGDQVPEENFLQFTRRKSLRGIDSFAVDETYHNYFWKKAK
jgi:hypothetical protein